MSKELKFYIGEENRIVLENIDKDVLEKSIFSNQYKKSLYTLDSYFALQSNKKDDGIEAASNVFAFIGERGSGKTSCMMSVAKLLDGNGKTDVFNKYTHLKTINFRSLNLIEPSFFDEYNNIISLVVSQIYTMFKTKRNENEEFADNDIRLRERDIIQCFDRIQRSLSQMLDAENNKPEDIDGLVNLAAAVNLRDDIRDLVNKILDYLGYNNGVLLVPIDDIDLNSSQATAMIEQIRKYLVNKNIIILMALKLDQLSQLKKQQFIKDYATLLDNRGIRMESINEMTERYISKLIPNSQRIYLPESEAFLFSPITIVLENLEEIKFPSLRQSVTELIFRKTRYLFYNSPGNTNFIVPRNLREIRQLTSMLAIMNDYVDEVKNGDSTNLYNKTLFKRYFFGNWTMANLSAEDQQYVKEIMDVADALQINSFVLNILNKRFEIVESPYINRGSYGRAIETVSDAASELRYLMDDSNKYYNISMGDVLSLLEILDKQHQNLEDRKFIFTIRTIYSILLYEFYDELTEQETPIKKRKSLKEVEFRRDMSSFNLSRLLQLMSGRIFNPRLEDNLLPKSNGRVSRTDRMIDLYELNRLTDDCLSDIFYMDSTRIRLTELFMLCISRVAVTQSRGTNENYIYPMFRSQRSWACIEPMESRQYGIFDLSSFFFNLQRIEECYSRFKNGKEFFDMVSDKACPSLYNEFKQLTINRKGNKKNAKYDENRWLSWCTIRNTEVYDAIMSDLRNYDYKDSGNDSVVIRHFFEIISRFHMQTYDRNPEGKDYYEIDYSFLAPVVELLGRKDAQQLFNNLFISATAVSQKNRKSVIDEEGNVVYDERVDVLMKRQFKNPPYNQRQVYRRLISPKGISNPKREVLLEMTKNYDMMYEYDIRHLIQSYFAFVDDLSQNGKSTRNA